MSTTVNASPKSRRKIVAGAALSVVAAYLLVSYFL